MQAREHTRAEIKWCSENIHFSVPVVGNSVTCISVMDSRKRGRGKVDGRSTLH